MRRTKALRRALSLAALALLALPAPALANPLGLPRPLLEAVPPQLRAQMQPDGAPKRSEATSFPSFTLKGRHGYRVDVVGFGESVVIQVARPHRHAPATAYIARGTVSGQRLQASFGKYGEVTMSFRPAASAAAKPGSGCHHRGRLLMTHGLFVGDFRFRGEGGYLDLDLHRAAGSVARLVPRCPEKGPARAQQSSVRPSQESPFGLEPDFFFAGWRQAVDSASIAALRFPKKTLYVASSQQSEGAIAKVRFAFAVGPSGTFDINGPLTVARLAPPAPFKGSGTYLAAPDGSTTWTGSLSVNFPGAPHFALTGEPFKPTLGAGF